MSDEIPNGSELPEDGIVQMTTLTEMPMTGFLNNRRFSSSVVAVGRDARLSCKSRFSLYLGT